METRSIRLGPPQIELLERISHAGTLSLDALQLDEVMALGSLRLISLEAGAVSLTPRGNRFLAYSLETAPN
ncbi:hypothetical protein [Solimonas sp. SE-A11]|uniref:hypothetical protein n=1 Tax=Solimonas sp. SE-A11 TaxID=3054954 RepID=UPI00259CCF22|nr:hypothetical protein [Solimonas sp. SE-A11]MDM4771868.1 hypothetical protein [Solimonas sp. SE-A11]